jgi:hypothetical protein
MRAAMLFERLRGDMCLSSFAFLGTCRSSHREALGEMGLPGVFQFVETALPHACESRRRGRLSRGRRSVGLGDPAGLRVPGVRKRQLSLQTNGLELVPLDDVRRRSALVQDDPFQGEPTKSFLKLFARHGWSFAAPLTLGQGADWRLKVRLTRTSSNSANTSAPRARGDDPRPWPAGGAWRRCWSRASRPPGG